MSILIVQVDVSVRVCPEDWFFMFESWRLWHAVAPSKRLSNAETRGFATSAATDGVKQRLDKRQGGGRREATIAAPSLRSTPVLDRGTEYRRSGVGPASPF